MQLKPRQNWKIDQGTSAMTQCLEGYTCKDSPQNQKQPLNYIDQGFSTCTTRGSSPTRSKQTPFIVFNDCSSTLTVARDCTCDPRPAFMYTWSCKGENSGYSVIATNLFCCHRTSA